jgi:hypothetical protein
MTYTIIKTIEDKKSDEETSVILIVETDTEHVAVDFENSRYTKVKRWRFESGFVRLDDESRVEITRLLMSCSSDHAHGVYYQAPRQMELWEAMFAIGESPSEIPTDLFGEESNGNVPDSPAE